MQLLLFPPQPQQQQLPPPLPLPSFAAVMDRQPPNNDVLARQQHARCIMNLSTLLSSLVALYDRLYPDAAPPPTEASSAGTIAAAGSDDIGDNGRGGAMAMQETVPPPSHETVVLRARLVVLKRCIEQVEEQIRRLVQDMPSAEGDRNRLGP